MAARKGPVTIRELLDALAALPAEMLDQPLIVMPDGDEAEGFTLARADEGEGPIDLVRGALTLTNAAGSKGDFRENAIPQRGEKWAAAVWVAS